jgi:hypothetical protein
MDGERPHENKELLECLFGFDDDDDGYGEERPSQFNLMSQSVIQRYNNEIKEYNEKVAEQRELHIHHLEVEERKSSLSVIYLYNNFP